MPVRSPVGQSHSKSSGGVWVRKRGCQTRSVHWREQRHCPRHIFGLTARNWALKSESNLSTWTFRSSFQYAPRLTARRHQWKCFLWHRRVLSVCFTKASLRARPILSKSQHLKMASTSLWIKSCLIRLWHCWPPSTEAHFCCQMQKGKSLRRDCLKASSVK